ncbi:ribose 5-phosphate isomerase [Aeromonas hydrophila NJ-35]|nr:ribose-5-phosphate isomerase A [Aeromonas hydrophila ML09-119]AHX33334.1 ribose 5-phosphate isomerase [Aeromonas hydrophila subsp. hydrophila AL09-71]AHX70134.1 ribose 5-phosphate isomerase [Aeromonas hydrophila pc104A]AJE35848.1 ribose 5-phosphate isomerase [Aeromonas hydrophila J-1]AKJ34046.1 ribose 5-phosphate isomerase [Aeromonas hydrophila NJ-35]ALQ62935.1 ribose-5-phosphate isomerase [Aeromonas hydrophila]
MPAKTQLNGIMVGTVTHGLFAHRGADVVLIGTPDGVVIQ